MARTRKSSSANRSALPTRHPIQHAATSTHYNSASTNPHARHDSPARQHNRTTLPAGAQHRGRNGRPAAKQHEENKANSRKVHTHADWTKRKAVSKLAQSASSTSSTQKTQRTTTRKNRGGQPRRKARRAREEEARRSIEENAQKNTRKTQKPHTENIAAGRDGARALKQYERYGKDEQMYDSFDRRGDSGERRKPGRREAAICNVSESALFSSPHLPLSGFVRSACPTTCLFPTSLRARACLVLASRFSMFSLFAGMSTLDGARFQRPIAFDCSLFLYSAGFQVGLGMILGCFPPIGGVFAPLRVLGFGGVFDGCFALCDILLCCASYLCCCVPVPMEVLLFSVSKARL